MKNAKRTPVRKAAATTPLKKTERQPGERAVAKKGPATGSSKKYQAIALLKKGITLEALMKRFGWQRHTVRGFVSILGKSYRVTSTRTAKGERLYRIA